MLLYICQINRLYKKKRLNSDVNDGLWLMLVSVGTLIVTNVPHGYWMLMVGEVVCVVREGGYRGTVLSSHLCYEPKTALRLILLIKK